MTAAQAYEARPSLVEAFNAVDRAAQGEAVRWTSSPPPAPPPPMTLQAVAGELAALLQELKEHAGEACALRADLGGKAADPEPAQGFPLTPEGDGAICVLLRCVRDARVFANIAAEHTRAAANLI